MDAEGSPEEARPCLESAGNSTASSPLSKGSSPFSKDSSPLSTSPSPTSKESSPSEPEPCIRLDARNGPILLLLLLLCAGLVAIIFFAIGQWAALQTFGSRDHPSNATLPPADVSPGMLQCVNSTWEPVTCFEAEELGSPSEAAALRRIWEEAKPDKPSTPITRLPSALRPVSYTLHLDLTSLG